MDVVTSQLLDISPNTNPVLLHYYQQILLCLGYAVDAPPLADFLRRLYDLEGSWLIVSPICWEASHNDAKLIAVDAELALSEEEGRAWFEAFVDFAQHDISGSYYHDPYTWLIRVDHQPSILAKPVNRLRDQSILAHLTQLDTTFFWQRFLTEAQMFFNQHPLSHVGKVNGIWVWGSGMLNEPSDRLIIVDQPANLRWASLLSTNVQLYGSEKSYPDSTLFLIEDTMTLSLLREQLKSYAVHWYGQNGTQFTQPSPWWSRLWSLLC